MTTSTNMLLRAACRTMAQHGDDAIEYAQSRAQALQDDPTASGTWKQVSHLIEAIYDEGFYPGD